MQVLSCWTIATTLSHKKHLDCSKLHLNEKGSAKRSSLFLNYILESHEWHGSRGTKSDMLAKIDYATGESQLLTSSSIIPNFQFKVYLFWKNSYVSLFE